MVFVRSVLVFLGVASFLTIGIGFGARANELCKFGLGERFDIVREALGPGKPKGSYIREHARSQVGTELPIEVAVFESGKYRPEYDAVLRGMGYLGVAIRNPSDVEIIDRHNFLYAPEMVRWIMPAPVSIDAWMQPMNANLRRQTKRKLEASEKIRVEVKSLTWGDYALWQRDLFMTEVATKEGGSVWWPEPIDLAKRLGLVAPSAKAEVLDPNQVIPDFNRFFFYLPGEGGAPEQLVGGSLVHVTPDGSATVRAAAFEKNARANYDLGIRGLARLIEFAKENKLSWLSYGADPNPYGIDSTLGLLQFKAGLGMVPVPRPGSLYQLVKVLDTHLAQMQDGQTPSLVLFTAGGMANGQARIAARNAMAAAQSPVKPSRARRRAPAFPDQNAMIEASLAHLQPIQMVTSQPTVDARVPAGMTLLQVPIRR